MLNCLVFALGFNIQGFFSSPSTVKFHPRSEFTQKVKLETRSGVVLSSICSGPFYDEGTVYNLVKDRRMNGFFSRVGKLTVAGSVGKTSVINQTLSSDEAASVRSELELLGINSFYIEQADGVEVYLEQMETVTADTVRDNRLGRMGYQISDRERKLPDVVYFAFVYVQSSRNIAFFEKNACTGIAPGEDFL